MNKYHKNPRVLTEKQFKLLERDLKELGDLSGIVHDINSNEIISGNQRVSVFTPSDSDIEIIEEFNPPTKTGTIATGWIKYNGERYSYRRVKWTPEKCEKANIVANKAGGSWDWDILANEFDFDSLKDWGFSEEETVNNYQKKTPQKINLIPYNKTHILITINPQDYDKIKKNIEQLKNIKGVEIEQNNN